MAYWPLNQTSGSVKDAKGGHPLVLAGTDWSVGHDGDALSFDGSSSRATGGPVVNTSRSFTVAAWVRLGSADHDYETIVSQNGRVTFGFNLRCIDHKWYFTTDPSDTLDRALSISSPSPAKEGVWTYLTGVYDAGAGKILLYVNGRFAASSPVAGVFDATGSLTVGYDPFKGKPSWYNGYFSGQIDDLRVYGVALTSSQVAQLPTLTG